MATPIGVAPNNPQRGATAAQTGARPPVGFNSWDEYNYWKANDPKGQQAGSYDFKGAQALDAATLAAKNQPSPVAAAPSFFGGQQPVSKGGFTSMFGTPSPPSPQDAVRYTGKPIPTVGSQPRVPPPGPVGSAGTPGGSQVPSPWGQPQIQSQPQDRTSTGAFNFQPPGLVNTGTPGSYAQQPTFNAYGGSTSAGTQINPNESLRTQQFLPGSTQNPYDAQAIAALNAVQGGNVQNPYDVQAAGALGGANMPTEFSPMVGETRDMIMNRLRGLSGPDRTQLAKEAFDIFQQQNEPRYQQELRGVGQKAAALGRVGAGLTTNELTDVWSQRNRDLDLMQRGLINEAAGQTLQDRLNTLQATLSGSGTLEGQDFGRQSAASQLAMQKAGMLGQFGQNQFGREQANAGLGLEKAGFLQGMGSEEFGRQQQNYQQNAQERAYQDYLARTAVEDRIRQQEMQQRQAQDEWERSNRANLLAAQLAGQQNTQYPGIAQPQGDSFGAGQMAGAGTPTYSTGGAGPVAQEPYFDPNVWAGNPGLGLQNQPGYDPASVFYGNQGLGLQNQGYDPNSIFRNQRFGLQE